MMAGSRKWIGAGSVTALAMLALAVWASGCGDGGVEPQPPDPPRPTSVTVTPATAALSALGATVRLSAQVRDQNGQVMAGASVAWSSSSASVATVDASGLVTAAANGAATVTATAGTASGTASVTVAQSVSAVVVTPADDTVLVADTVRFVAGAFDANGHAVAGAEFSWASSDTLVAVVDGAGLVTGVAEGEAEITATSSGVTGRAAVGVAPPLPTTVTVTPDTVAFTALGQTMRLAAVVRDQVGRPMEGAAVSWSSSDTIVARVDSAGLVTAAAGGTTTVTATVGDVAGVAVVTVMQSAGSVNVSPLADTIAPGDTLRLVAEAFDENGHRVQGPAFVWASSDVTVILVDPSGLVTGVAEGRATVTARAGEAGAASEITVENPDRAALAAFYHATGGPNWNTSENWLTDAPLDQWHGVTVDRETGRVVEIWLSRNNLTGPIPPEIGNLTALTRLNLFRNHLTGPIPPEILNLSGLTLLNLYASELHGPIPPEISELANLTYLNLSRNQLTGRIPSELGRLGSLETLGLGGNDLTGPIPPNLGELSNLRSLGLGDNNLSGKIPPELGNLANLQSLSLSHGSSAGGLTGPIPPTLGNLENLQFLNLWANRLTGPIPPELGNLGNLQRLWLHTNQLTGGIPREIGNLADLEELWLSNNLLTGGIPVEVGNLGSLRELVLFRNDLTGTLPAELANLRSLTDFNLSWNDLAGPIPDGFLELERLKVFGFEANVGLCAPGTADFVTWLEAIEWVRGPYCNESDVKVLERLYEVSGGANWTNSGGWFQTPVLDEWHGVTADALGRVVTLDLSRNGLTGALPVDLGNLAELTALRVDGNALSGRLPLSLTRMALTELRYSDTGLCVPADAAFRTWLSGIASHDGTGAVCDPLSDREILEILYDATDGPGWTDSDNWLTDAPLGDWHGVYTDASGRVVTLWLYGNGLSGSIPPELANLTELEGLALTYADLTGPIPPALGDLGRLERLWLSGNALSGRIPSELANPSNLWALLLSENNLTGPIPPELGNLASLRQLWLSDNGLTGPIPPELGNLANLRQLWLEDNDLNGPLPPELGRLSRLRELNLQHNALTGTLPQEFGALAALEQLGVGGNPGLSGVLPASLTALRRLETFVASGTGLCAPPEGGFLNWLRDIPVSQVQLCSQRDGTAAYLTQTVQSLGSPVPLIAGEEALLRVFVTAPSATSANLPPVRATFYVDGTEALVTNIDAGASPIPVEVDEGDLSKSLNALVPAEIVQPGLEIVIEIDPDGTLDPELGVSERIPATGRQAVEVHTMPLLDLTLVPFVWTEDPDSAVIDAIESAARDPESDDLLAYIRTLMPVGSLAVTAHAPVGISTNDADELLGATDVIRVMEGGGGHYMGTMSGTTSGALGVAKLGGRSAYSRLAAQIMAHELGHNFSLLHAPCGVRGDRYFPYSDGRIGVWGYDFADGGTLIWPTEYDVMTYCGGEWISDYHFIKAFRNRLADEGASAAAAGAVASQSLLLWGGVDSTGIPNLKPAFVVEAPLALPDSVGAHTIVGRNGDGAELFSLSFAMPETADGDGSSSFAFVLPVRPGWEGNLASVTLSGPGGSVTLDGGSDVPMAILRNPQTGQVRGILRGPPVAAQAAADAVGARASGLEVYFSRGIPNAEAWRQR